VTPRAALDTLYSTVKALLANTSDTASLALAELVVRRYASLDPDDRLRFLSFMLDELGPSAGEVDVAIDAYRIDRSQSAVGRLFRAAESRRQALFRAINMAPGGTWTVLTMRGDLLAGLADHPELAPVEDDLFHVLSSWFNRGFIVLQQISWRSPGSVLERLIRYEAVHEIRGWGDLRRRLEADRRCFGFFHPAVPDEPLVFIEVALTRGYASSIQDILDAPVDELDAANADTAIFYSITNCQPGLRGIPLGNFLIKQVVHELTTELPGLASFATISPVPGFVDWLTVTTGDSFFNDADRRALSVLDDASWFKEPACADIAKPLLLRACAHFIVDVKRRGLPADSVARFHLRNGARLERINWLADVSPNGMRQSHGVLVNYVYDEAEIAGNHEAYVYEGAIARSASIDALLSGGETV
jgi:malonyl-CoA decarboxylase